MKVFKTVDSVKRNLLNLDKKFSLALVPTMGALHQGHLSIVKRAKRENDFVVVSIFVNPTQFDNENDLKKYPITLHQDLKLLEDLDCDLVFVPTANEVYNANIESEKFDFNGLDKAMEGTHRKGHFDGVGTVVKKLFEIIKPDKAYFGEKDFQQLQIINKLTEISKLQIKIVGCEIYREKDGLAMSSRNTRLTEKQRKSAPLIYQTLVKSKALFLKKDIIFIKKFIASEFKKEKYLQLEYFEIADVKTLTPASHVEKSKKYRAFIAAFSGSIRLIDNIALN